MTDREFIERQQETIDRLSKLVESLSDENRMLRQYNEERVSIVPTNITSSKLPWPIMKTKLERRYAGKIREAVSDDARSDNWGDS